MDARTFGNPITAGLSNQRFAEHVDLQFNNVASWNFWHVNGWAASSLSTLVILDFITLYSHHLRVGVSVFFASPLTLVLILPNGRCSPGVLTVRVDGSLVWQLGYTPKNLACNLNMNPWKRRFLLETIIFRFHVKFRGCTVYALEHLGIMGSWESYVPPSYPQTGA